MKKVLLFIALLIGIGTQSQAQSVSGDATGSAPLYQTTKDTSTNAGDITKVIKVANRAQSVTLQANMVVVSGTTTSNTIKWYASADNGSTYVLLYTDTMAATSTPYSHVITGNPYTHYKAIVDGVGTQVSTYQIFVLVR